jgi:hypothetical protein
MDLVELLGYLALFAMLKILVITNTEELEALAKCEASYSNQRRKHIYTSSLYPIALPILYTMHKLSKIYSKDRV